MTEPDYAKIEKRVLEHGAAERQLRCEVADAMAHRKHRCFTCFGHVRGMTPEASRILEQTAAFLIGRK